MGKDKILDFKNKESYQRYLRYGYSHDVNGKLVKETGKKNVFEATPGQMGVRIGNKLIRRPHD